MHNYFLVFTPNTHCALVVALLEKKQVPFSVVIGNGELMHECFSKHSPMGTARTKFDKQTYRSNGLSHRNQNTIIIINTKW